MDGYRSMAVYLGREGYRYSATTIHKYMNTQMGLRSVVRPKKPGIKPGKSHKVFENRLKQDFTAERINCKWCTEWLPHTIPGADSSDSFQATIQKILATSVTKRLDHYNMPTVSRRSFRKQNTSKKK